MNAVLLLSLALAAPTETSATNAAPVEEDIRLLRAADLPTDGPALLAFFRTRAHPDADGSRLAELVRDLGSPGDEDHLRAGAELVAHGPVAVPWLRKGVNDLESPVIARRARDCLSRIEGEAGAELTAAAVRVLAHRRPEGAAEALLAYLPFSESQEVAAAISEALRGLAFAEGKTNGALVRGLKDEVPLRRAVAGEALCRAEEPEELPRVRELLKDPKPAVRLRAALALAKQKDAEAVPVLIDLLAELPAKEREPVEEVLRELAGRWAPELSGDGDDAISRRLRRDVWRAWWENTAGPALLEEFRSRTLTAEGRVEVQALVADLGSDDFKVREKAVTKLVAKGELGIPFLEELINSKKDLEAVRLAEECVKRIERDESNPLPVAAVRLMALRKPPGAAGVLLDYLPHAREEALSDEVRSALAFVAFPEGKPDPALLAALADKSPLRRAAAAGALAGGEGDEVRSAVRKLLKDGDTGVRLRVATALAVAKDREAVPVLIELLNDLPTDQAFQAQDLLVQLAGNDAPEVAIDDDKDARLKSRDAWRAWWARNKDKADLARLTATRSYLGYTVLCLVSDSGQGQVVELDRSGKVRWRIDGIQYPVDAWVLPGNRVLIAEYNGNRVTERDLSGKVLWEHRAPGNVFNVQRLPNGHTFIAATNRLMIVDQKGTEVAAVPWTTSNVWAGYRDRNGDIVFLAGNECIRTDTTGKVLKRFMINSGGSWTSGIDLLPRGGVLVAEHNTNKVAEHDADGKRVWEADAQQITTATALRNGHVLVASYNMRQVKEIDRKGKVVWEHTDPMYIFRARRR